MAAAAESAITALAQMDSRDVDALTSTMDVNADDPGTADYEIAVYSSHMDDGTMVSERYVTNPDAGVCDCPDMLHRRPTGGCKHLRRVWVLRGELPLPPGINRDALADDVREHFDSGVGR